jgi:serine/threonine-protein kinase
VNIVTGVSVGDVLAGKFRVDEIIGMGGMGVVIGAHHLQLDERVAIKFLLPEALTNGEAVARFAREARAAVKIKNEHVARVSDVGQLENGAPYMVMEYLEGVDLAKLIKQRGQLPVAEAVDYVLQACEALAEAHGLGIIHRDLKPSNLFIIRRRDGSFCVKLLDFGISKVVGRVGSGADMGMTRTTAVMGSPLYMSPEQMESSRKVDARTDIWAVGVILYELLSGRRPFEGETLPEICIKIATSPLPPLQTSRPGVPAQLEAVIGRCLEKDRNRRFANVGELAQALLDFAPPQSRASVERVCRTVEAAGLSVRPSAPSSPEGRYESPTGTELVLNATLGDASGRTSPRSGGGKKAVVALLAVVAVGIAGTAAFLRHSTAAPELVSTSPAAAAQAAPPAPPAEAIPAPMPDPPLQAAAPPYVAPPSSAAPDKGEPVRATPPPRGPTPIARPVGHEARPAPAAHPPNPSPPANAAQPVAAPAAKGNVYDDRK